MEKSKIESIASRFILFWAVQRQKYLGKKTHALNRIHSTRASSKQFSLPVQSGR